GAAAALHRPPLRLHDLGRRGGRNQGPPRHRSLAREVLLGRRVPRPRHPRHVRRRASLAPFRRGVAELSSASARRVGTGLGPWSPRPGLPRAWPEQCAPRPYRLRSSAPAPRWSWRIAASGVRRWEWRGAPAARDVSPSRPPAATTSG